MVETECVTQFMHAFFQETDAEKILIPIESVKLLAQAVTRYQRAWTSYLRLTENVFQNRNVEINICDREKAPMPGLYESMHALQDLGGMVLLALGMISRSNIEFDRKNFASHVEALRDRSA